MYVCFGNTCMLNIRSLTSFYIYKISCSLSGGNQFVCSFFTPNDTCGHIIYKKTWPRQIIPLTCCNLSIDAHLRQFSICRNIQSESELLKTRGGFFSEDDEILTICPKHRYVTCLTNVSCFIIWL